MSDTSHTGSAQPTEPDAPEALLLQGDLLDELEEPTKENDGDNNNGDPQRTAISTSPCSASKTPTNP
jgi:hypothetical protein